MLQTTFPVASTPFNPWSKFSMENLRGSTLNKRFIISLHEVVKKVISAS